MREFYLTRLKCFPKTSCHPNCVVLTRIFYTTCPLTSTENWQKKLDESGVIGTVLMDLNKEHDCLPHDHLLIAKLATYGFEDSGPLFQEFLLVLTKLSF